MADKDWKKRLEAIGNTPMDDTSKRIMAGIEASKKRNAELAAENAKRRKNEESGYTKKSEAESKSAPKRSTVSSAKSTAAVAAATTVRQHKGGGATAEVDTAKVERQTKADAAKKPPSSTSASQEPKKESKPLRTLSSSDSEAQKEKAAEGARKTAERARNAVGTSPRKYYDNEAKTKRRRIAGRSILTIIRDHTGRRSRKDK